MGEGVNKVAERWRAWRERRRNGWRSSGPIVERPIQTKVGLFANMHARNAWIVHQVRRPPDGAGRSYTAVGEDVGLTFERVRQICMRNGVYAATSDRGEQERAEDWCAAVIASPLVMHLRKVPMLMKRHHRYDEVKQVVLQRQVAFRREQHRLKDIIKYRALAEKLDRVPAYIDCVDANLPIKRRYWPGGIYELRREAGLPDLTTRALV